MKNFSPFYAFTWAFVRPAIHIFYKKIEINNPQNFPEKGAVFICSNHVNAFMDPVSVQLNSRRQIFSLARGDAFKKPVMNWLLTQWKVIPIYRLSEGAENLKKNDYSFSTSKEVLMNGNALVIYPEAICVQERRLRKLKKGAARIAFAVEEETGFRSNMVVLPIGLNYSSPKKFRSKLLMNFGTPISLLKYKELYQQDKAKAMNAFTADLEKAMRSLVLNIEHKENDVLVEDLLEIFSPVLLARHKLSRFDLVQKFKADDEVIKTINYLQHAEPALVETIRQGVSKYTSVLNKYGLRDYLLTEQELQKTTAGKIVFDLIISIIASPIFFVGCITNCVPYKMAYCAANKLAKEVEFHASINMTVGWLSWITYFLIQLLIVALTFHNWSIVALFAILIPATGFFALNFYDWIKKSGGRRRVFDLRRKNNPEFTELIQLGKNVQAELKRGRAKYLESLQVMA